MMDGIKKILMQIANGNNLGEAVTLVAATKTRTPQEINLAIKQGILHIGENSVQEFMQKLDQIDNCNRHFIGHLQTNKVKYLIGKTFLIHSLDRQKLAEEISSRSIKQNVVTNVLMQINIGNQATKGGFLIEDAQSAYNMLKNYKGLRIKGLMAMLPDSCDQKLLANLCQQMRKLYDTLKKTDKEFEYLSVGMSGDYEIALQNGSNMIRLGSALFGQRNYKSKENNNGNI